MKSKLMAAFVLIVGLLIVSAPLLAHHGAAAFENDPAKRVTVKGTVVEWFWANPHCFLQFDVKGEDGKMVRWVTETSNPPDMINRGWSIRSFKPGDEVTVVIRPVKSGKPVGSVIKVTKADGTVLSAGGEGPAPAPAAGAPAAGAPGRY
jgi:Family of unknown function (DUF6152)